MSNVRRHKVAFVRSQKWLLALASALLSYSATASGQEAKSYSAAEASWSTGEGAVLVSSNAQVKELAAELGKLKNQPSKKFAGKVGPCAKRVTLKSSDPATSNDSYYFVGGTVIVLNPGKDREGQTYAYSEKSLSEVSVVLSEIRRSKACNR